MIETIYTFIICWVMVFLLHELCHLLEAMRQGTPGAIRVWKFGVIPSFIAIPDGEIRNKFLFALSGGLYSGLLILPLAIISLIRNYEPFAFTFTTLAVINICYSFFEAKYLFSMDRRKYMIIHYLIYIVICIIMFILFYVVKILD